jgi:hypothetical protein
MKYSPDYTRFLAPVQKTNSAPPHHVHHREPTCEQPTRPKLCPHDNIIQLHNTHDHKQHHGNNAEDTGHITNVHNNNTTNVLINTKIKITTQPTNRTHHPQHTLHTCTSPLTNKLQSGPPSPRGPQQHHLPNSHPA